MEEQLSTIAIPENFHWWIKYDEGRWVVKLVATYWMGWDVNHLIVAAAVDPNFDEAISGCVTKWRQSDLIWTKSSENCESGY